MTIGYETHRIPTEVPPLTVQLGRVALVSCDPEEFPWLAEEGVRYFDVHAGTPAGERIGDFDVFYNYARRRASIHVAIDDDFQGQGIGRELYAAVPALPLPSGEQFRENGFRLYTFRHSLQAERVWLGLLRRGMAVRLGGVQEYESTEQIRPFTSVTLL